MATISRPASRLKAATMSSKAFDNLAAAINKLSPQFKELTSDTQAFGAAGTQASQQVTAGLNQTSAGGRASRDSVAVGGRLASGLPRPALLLPLAPS